MPTKANEIIRFLNSKNREELEDLKIEDMTIRKIGPWSNKIKQMRK
jgi:ubiquinone biosynthesis protein COQ9